MNHIEAMKQALEALKNVTVTGPDDDGLVWINLPGNGTTGKAILRVGKAGLIAAQCAKLYEEQRTKAIKAIKQACALDKKADNARELGLDYEPEERYTYGTPLLDAFTKPAPVQEPVACVQDLDEVKRKHLVYEKGMDWKDPLYTTPPGGRQSEDCLTAAQRPVAEPHKWIGLTDEEVFETHKQVDSMQYLTFGKAIEAKLREKNGWYRQHATDGSPCWCEPEISYTNPETGASVIVHKEPQ